MLDKILNIHPCEFEHMALELFGWQARECIPYAEYLDLIGVLPDSVRRMSDIPFLPIEIFKTHRVYCGAAEPEHTFVSSGTSGTGNSKHHIARTGDYERTFRRGFGMFYGSDVHIYALLPGYRPDSSLVYMVHGLGGRFYMGDPEALLHDMAADSGRKILFGVSHALLDLAENHPSPLPHGTIVMETGGMKGRREELSKHELHRILRNAFGVESVHSEYGMAELSSQAYSASDGRFVCPPWMRVVARDMNDPFTLLPPDRRGGLDIIDLANLHSCAFIQTQDVGSAYSDNSFSVDGRMDRSEIRGCNLL